MSRLGTAVDHVLLAVSNLDAGADEVRQKYGLEALAGGRHPGAGTANMIVPLGRDYLELIAIVDAREAATNVLSRRVSNALAAGSRLASWAVRVTDLAAVEGRVRESGLPTDGPRQGSRLRPDGTLLRWRTLHIGDGLRPSVPFFIEWDLPAADHPGALNAAHPGGRAELVAVRVMAQAPDEFGQMLKNLTGQPLAVDIVGGPADRLLEVELRREGREMMIR